MESMMKKKTEWKRLENVSKVFPSTTNARDTKVFRFSCELWKDVRPEILQTALDETIKDFPMYRSVLRRGVFWYYFQYVDERPLVGLEDEPVCAPIYDKNSRNLLFRVRYFRKRIVCEVYHSISDGTGALFFMQTLVHHYIVLAHGDEISEENCSYEYQPSLAEKMKDSFEMYFKGQKYINVESEKTGIKKIYKVRGRRTEDFRVNLVEGVLPASFVMREVARYDTTVSVYLVAVLIQSIHRARTRLGEDWIGVAVPINLRQFYKSATMRNFFSIMRITYSYAGDGEDFSHLLRTVEKEFQRGLDENVLRAKMARLQRLETNFFTRILPLPVKDAVLRIANFFENRLYTSSLSNMGRVKIPEEFSRYIREFAVCVSARKPQICLLTYGDRMTVSFTSPFVENEIQRQFFTHFTDLGADVEITANNP